MLKVLVGFVVAVIAAQLVPVSHAKAQAGSICQPIDGIVSHPFFGKAYADSLGVQHLGLDIDAPIGATVVSPVTGTVIVNRTGRDDINNAYLIIRDSATGQEHVLGHIASDLADESTIECGEPVDTIRDWPSDPGNEHLHWGINQGSILGTFVRNVWGFGQGPYTASVADAAGRGWIDPATISTFRDRFASYSDTFLANDEVEVRVTAQANRRDYPSTQGTQVIGSLEPGAMLKGRWVRDMLNDRRWLKIATGGYVWDGNLREAGSVSILGTWELVGRWCCGEREYSDDQAWKPIAPRDKKRVTFFGNGRFESTWPNNPEGNWSAEVEDDGYMSIDGWSIYRVGATVEGDMMTVSHVPTSSINAYLELWRRVGQAASSPPTQPETSKITTDGMFGVRAGIAVGDYSNLLDMAGVFGSQIEGWNTFECEVYNARDGSFSVLAENGIVGAIITTSTDVETLSGAKVGMTSGQLKAIYGRNLKMQPNPYVELPGADYFVYSGSGNGVKFTVGEDDRVMAITAGGNAIEYVEGCL